jgi:hypothetical protein
VRQAQVLLPKGGVMPVEFWHRTGIRAGDKAIGGAMSRSVYIDRDRIAKWRWNGVLRSLLILGAGRGGRTIRGAGGRARRFPTVNNLALAAIAPGLLCGSVAKASTSTILDDFDHGLAGWTAHPAAGVEMTLTPEAGLHGKAMRIDFRFSGGGWAIARRELDLALPANYAFGFWIRGRAPVKTLEFKLVDPSGENVWWNVHRDFRWPEEWEHVAIKKRQISFAWGPAGGGEIGRAASLEIVVTAGTGGEGTIWIDDLELRELPPPGAVLPPPAASASTSAPASASTSAPTTTPPSAPAIASGHPPASQGDGFPSAAIDGDTLTAWRSAPTDRAPAFTLDMGVEREFGGLVLDWGRHRHPTDYDVETSPDGTEWRTVRTVRGSNGARDPLPLAESEARFIRIRVRPTLSRRDGPTPVNAPPDQGWEDHGVELRELLVMPLEWSATPEAFFRQLAREAPRGSFPRGVLGEPVQWTLVGPGDGNVHEGLLDTDGRLETGKACWSLEPFLYTGNRLLTWSELRLRPSLLEGDLPIPIVEGQAEDLRLRVTAFATGRALIARYLVQNAGNVPRSATLYLALRPFQVNPPAQFLNTPGGVAPIRSIRRDGRAVLVNEAQEAEAPGAKPVDHPGRGLVLLTIPSAFGALSFDQGDLIADFLRGNRVPESERVQDSFERASGALAYQLTLNPGQEREVAVQVPLQGPPREAEAIPSPDAAQDAVQAAWHRELDSVQVVLPTRRGREITASIRAQLAWILINRDGAAIQPGSRSYERSWIRDGALTSTALLRLGRDDIVRDFLLWFAGFQYPDGKVPCCVDRRGADPVPEHDSHGELIYLAAEYYRYTGDIETARRVWPAVAKAAAYLDTLRAQRRTDEWRQPGKEQFFGLLPPSISHEGYSAKPMHSYWDDFFALRGLRDAAFLAGELGLAADAERLARDRDEFTGDLQASLAATLRVHGIDYVPGCADLGDFDATSTTIALSPCAATGITPPGALERTFEKYWEFFRERRDGKPWEAFTPYEMRNIGAFVRLGWRDRAQDLLGFFLDHRSPPAWMQWAEVVWSDSTTQRFIGDLPHTWCGSDFVRSALDLLAYDREEDGTLVLAAGVPWDWLIAEGGVQVRNLATPYGRLSYTAEAASEDSHRGGGRHRGATDRPPSSSARMVVTMAIREGLRIPAGGIVVALPQAPERRAAGPRERPFRATVNGRPAPSDEAGRIVIREVPATIVIRG